jgi:hypothetical protein
VKQFLPSIGLGWTLATLLLGCFSTAPFTLGGAGGAEADAGTNNADAGTNNADAGTNNADAGTNNGDASPCNPAVCATTANLTSLSDSFGAMGISNDWCIVDNHESPPQITDGHLEIQPSGGWYTQERGSFFYKQISGSFAMVASIVVGDSNGGQAAGTTPVTDVSRPSCNWANAGLMARVPPSSGNFELESLLTLEVGNFDSGNEGYLIKQIWKGMEQFGRNSTETFEAGNFSGMNARVAILGMCRISDGQNDYFRLAHYEPNAMSGMPGWPVIQGFQNNSNLQHMWPDVLQVGVSANSWSPSMSCSNGLPGLIAWFDYVAYAPVDDGGSDPMELRKRCRDALEAARKLF